MARGIKVERPLFVNFEDARLVGHLDVALLGLIKDVYMVTTHLPRIPIFRGSKSCKNAIFE